MKKAVFVLLLSVSNLLIGQVNILFPSLNGELWGAIDIERNIVIPYKYSNVNYLSDSYYLVENTDGKGVINYAGEIIIKCQYDEVFSLGNDLFKVYKGRKVGIVTIGNKLVVPVKFSSILYNDNLGQFIATEKNGSNSVYSSSGKELLAASNIKVVFFNNKAYLFRKNGKLAVSNSLANINRVKYYDNIMFSGNSYLTVSKGKYGLLDNSGKQIIKSRYKGIKVVSDNLFLVMKDESYAFFDNRGKRLSSYSFTPLYYYFENGFVWIKNDEGQWKRFDSGSRKITNFNFGLIIDEKQDFVRVLNGDYMNVYDKNENIILGGEFHDVEPLNDSLFKVRFDNQWGVYSVGGKKVLPVKFSELILKEYKRMKHHDDRVGVYEELNNAKVYPDLFLVAYKTKWGVYSLSGDEIVPPEFDKVEISPFKSAINVKKESKYGAYNRKSEKIVDCNFYNLLWNEFQQNFIVKTDSSYMVLNTQGDTTVYKLFEKFKWSEKKNILIFNQGEIKGLVDVKGNILLEGKYSDLYDMSGDFFVAAKEDVIYLFDKSANSIGGEELIYSEIMSHGDSNYIKVKNLSGKVGVFNSEGIELVPMIYDDVFLTEQGVFEIRSESGLVLGYYDNKGVRYW